MTDDDGREDWPVKNKSWADNIPFPIWVVLFFILVHTCALQNEQYKKTKIEREAIESKLKKH